jgi:hypothetical protein
VKDIEAAFEQLRSEENDLILDFPALRVRMRSLLAECVRRGLITQEFVKVSTLYEV